MTDEEVIAAHDAKWNVAEGASFWLDELRRRDAMRAEAASYNLARRAYRLTVANFVLAGVAAAAAVAAILVSIVLAHSSGTSTSTTQPSTIQPSQSPGG